MYSVTQRNIEALQNMQDKFIRVYIKDPVDGMSILSNDNREMLYKWCEENCQGPFWIGMGFGMFIEEEDASLFALRWVFNSD